jgi:hypothetical protein
MTANISGGCFEFSTESIGGTWSWKVRSNNLQGLGIAYEVIDIYSPWGPFPVTELPIPSNVITEMADSITSIQDQFAPLLALVDPTVTTFNVIIVEGDPNQAVGDVAIMNVGAFGSFMTATATPSAASLEVTPSSITGLGKNDQGTFNISLLTATLLSSSSPYSETITIQDNRTPPTTETISVNITVHPRPTIGYSPTSISLTFISSTNTPGGAQQLTVSNVGPTGSTLEYTVASINSSSWLEFTPTSGGPLTPGVSSIVTISVDAAAASSLAPGSYSDTLRISSTNATNTPVDIIVTLTVT